MRGRRWPVRSAWSPLRWRVDGDAHACHTPFLQACCQHPFGGRRYSGAGISYNVAAIVGAAFAPTIAIWLADNWGVRSVGIYLGVMAVACFVALATTKETKSVDFTK